MPVSPNKKYFSKSGTVVNWWYPGEGKSPFDRLYDEQLEMLEEGTDFRDRRVIDLGVGRGRFSVLTAINHASEIVGVDISLDMINVTRKNFHESFGETLIKLVLADCENLPIRAECFDIAICMETVVHLPDPRGGISEIKRILKAGGLAVMNATLSGRLWKWLYRVSDDANYIPHRELRGVEFKKIITDTGLIIKSIICQGPPFSKIFMNVWANKEKG